MNNDEKLEVHTQLDIIAQAGIAAIPVIGGSLATLYFGKKQEQRFQRLERFYEELRALVESNLDQILPPDQHEPASLSAIISEINECVEADLVEEKIKYFQACFVNSLKTDNSDSSDRKRQFVRSVLELTNLELEILVALDRVGDEAYYLYKPDDEEIAPAFNAGLENLRSRGFISARMGGPLQVNVNWGEITRYSLSPYGREFVGFCGNDT